MFIFLIEFETTVLYYNDFKFVTRYINKSKYINI